MPIEARPIDLENPFAASRAQFEALAGQLGAGEALVMTHSAVEELLHVAGFGLLRQLFQDHLDLRAVREGLGETVTGSDGVTRTHHRDSSRPLESLFGRVTVNRIEYRARSGSGLRPLDAVLNLPDDIFSHGVRRRAAVEVARGSFDAAIGAISATTGAHLAKRQAEELAIKAATDFDAFYASRAGSIGLRGRESLLVISADGKGIVMRHEDLRDATRKAAETTPRKLAKRLTSGEKRNRKRMATVAAVYTIGKFVRGPADILDDLRRQKKAENRPRPFRKRVWASVEKEPETVIREAIEEAQIRDPRRKKRWVALVDGNATQIRILGDLAAEFDVHLTIVLDIIHVIEYLWAAAHVFHHPGTPAAENWVNERLLRILNGDSSLVAGGMRRSATYKGMNPKDREAVDRCAGYLLNHTALLKYDEFLAAGMPIASGVIEGACRHLIGDRMDITGARWSLKGAEAVLRLRALCSSGDFEAYWTFHLDQEARRNHAALLAGPLTRPADTAAGPIAC